jgi:hypothetical protein
VGAEFFMRRDGQTDVTKIIVAFRNFAKAPKNEVEVALQRKIPGFGTARKFKVSLAPAYLPVESEDLLISETPCRFIICYMFNFKISESSSAYDLLLLPFLYVTQ